MIIPGRTSKRTQNGRNVAAKRSQAENERPIITNYGGVYTGREVSVRWHLWDGHAGLTWMQITDSGVISAEANVGSKTFCIIVLFP